MRTTLTSRLPALIIAITMCASSINAAPIPTVLATDIGSDVDDTWALAHLLRSPELDLKMVLTETGEARYRARVAARLLEAAGRGDVDVALGVDFGEMPDSERHQGPWVEGYALEDYPGAVHEDGVAAFVDLVNGSSGTVNVIAIGPAPSLAEAIRRDAGIAAKCCLIGMFGSFDLGYGGSTTPSAEANVRVDPEALRAVLSAEWKEVLLTPLDTCGLVNLDGENYHAIWSATGDPLLRGLIENYCIWAPRVPWMDCDFFTTRSSTLFDCVAVYMAYAEDLLAFDVFSFRVTDDGFTVRDADGPYTARIAMRWTDLPAFEKHLSRRLLGRE